MRLVDALLPADRTRRWIVLAVAVGALIRLAFCWYLHRIGFVYTDEDAYWHIAQRLRAGHGFTMEYDGMAGVIRAGEPTAFWGCFLSIVVAGLQVVCREDIFACRIILGQVAWLLTVAGALGLCRTSFDSRQKLLLVWGLALYPNFHFIASFLMTEVILVPLLLIALWAAREIKSPWGGPVSGVAFGLLHLTKATLVPFQPLLMIAIARREGRESRRGLALMALATALTFGPWVVRNTIHFHRVVLETKSGYNLWAYNNPRQSKPILEEDFKGGVDMPAFAPELDEPRRSDVCRDLFLDFLRKNPGRVAGLCVSRFLNVWSTAPLYVKIPSWMAVLARVANITLYGLMLWGAVLSLKRKILRECPAVIAYLTAVLTLTAPSFRQRSYADACMIILAALAVSEILTRLRPAPEPTP